MRRKALDASAAFRFRSPRVQRILETAAVKPPRTPDASSRCDTLLYRIPLPVNFQEHK
jgi:hypothetical protein